MTANNRVEWTVNPLRSFTATHPSVRKHHSGRTHLRAVDTPKAD